MNSPARAKPDDTRARIEETAEALFRRLGFAKTTVADIAGELRMSPANVYRFFPSKEAIVEAICQRCLSELVERAWAVARSRGSAASRMERLILEVIAYHKENFLTERRVHDIVLLAIEHNWQAIRAQKEALRAATEVILRDGMEAGEFERVDPQETSRLILHSLVGYLHPILVAKCLEENEDIDANARASVRFVLRAITPRS